MTETLINILAVIHLFIAVILISIVLLQSGKGDALGGAITGASSTIFGSEGSGNFLATLTRYIAFFFMLSCIALATLETRRHNHSVIDNTVVAPPIPPAGNSVAGGVVQPSPAPMLSPAPGMPKTPEANPGAPAPAVPPNK